MLSVIAYLLAMCKKPVGLSIPFCGDSVDSVWYRVVTFYPASGLRSSTSGAFDVTGVSGYAWSFSRSGVIAYYLGFNSLVVYPSHSNARAFGFPVRCVQYLLLSL
jgi:hypothetical protein